MAHVVFDGNQQLTINAVNSEVHNPSACAVIDAAYVSGPALGVARSRSHAFEITPIVVVGTTTQHGYRQVKPALFFHARKSQGICSVNNREPTHADEGFQRMF